jgi:prevent-host-death family protein
MAGSEGATQWRTEVGAPELRDHLSRYLSVVRHGEEVTVTDHGKAVARLVPLDAPRALDRLIADGVVTPARSTTRRQPRRRVQATGAVSDLVADQRR